MVLYIFILYVMYNVCYRFMHYMSGGLGDRVPGGVPWSEDTEESPCPGVPVNFLQRFGPHGPLWNPLQPEKFLFLFFFAPPILMEKNHLFFKEKNPVVLTGKSPPY